MHIEELLALDTEQAGEQLFAAADDGKQLVRWAAPNSAAVQADKRIEAAVFRALGGPVEPELAAAVPLLRHARHDTPAQPLLRALADGLPRHASWLCDLREHDTTDGSECRHGLIPDGASAATLSTCDECHEHETADGSECRHRLIVPVGASVVAIYMCDDCHHDLAERLRALDPPLVWG